MTAKSRNSLILACVALAACALVALYLLSIQGMKGFFTWYLRIPALPVALFVLSPLILALAGLPLKKAKSALAVILRLASGIFAALVILVSAGCAGFVHFTPRSGTIETPKLTLIDPSKGIALRDTAGSADGLLHVSLSSDPHWGKANSEATAREAILKGIAAELPARDALFMLGDNVELGMMTGQWKSEIADLERLVPSVPLRPILGNHDAILGGEYNFRRAFFPAGMKSDSGSPYYYSIQAGDAWFVILNLPWGTENFDKKQADWLEKTLASIPQEKPVIVLSHSFFYASGYNDPRTGVPWYDHPENIPTVSPILEKHKVDLVVSGHNHYMELLAHNGVTYAVIGAMGGIPDPLPSYKSPASLWFKDATFGWLDLDVSKTGIAMTFRDRNGAALETYSVPVSR